MSIILAFQISKKKLNLLYRNSYVYVAFAWRYRYRYVTPPFPLHLQTETVTIMSCKRHINASITVFI